MYREETLLNVIKSVTRNGRSIVLTAVLALILVYLFSIVGYIFFKDDFILEVDRVPNATTSEGGFLSLFHLNIKGEYLKENSPFLLCFRSWRQSGQRVCSRWNVSGRDRSELHLKTAAGR